MPSSPRALLLRARSHRSRMVLPTVYRPLWCQAAPTRSLRTCQPINQPGWRLRIVQLCRISVGRWSLPGASEHLPDSSDRVSWGIYIDVVAGAGTYG